MGKLTTEQIATICQRYSAGVSPSQLARDYGVTVKAINYHIEKAGLPPIDMANRILSFAKITNQERANIVKRRNEGVSIAQLAREHKVTRQAIAYHIKRANILPVGDDTPLERFMISLHPLQKQALEAYTAKLNIGVTGRPISMSDVVRGAVADYLNAHGQECPSFIVMGGYVPNRQITPPSAQISQDDEGLLYPSLVEMSR